MPNSLIVNWIWGFEGALDIFFGVLSPLSLSTPYFLFSRLVLVLLLAAGIADCRVMKQKCYTGIVNS